MQRRRRLRPCAAAGAAAEPASRSVVVLPGLGNNSKVGAGWGPWLLEPSWLIMQQRALGRSCPQRSTNMHGSSRTLAHPLQDYGKLVEQLQQRGLHVEVAPVSRLDW